MDVQNILVQKQLGNWKPNQYLSNKCIAYFEEPEYASKRLFPICPVNLPSGFYYTFSKADLARDNVRRKPDYGSVTPAVLGFSDDSYSCHVDQIILGVDKIILQAYQASSPALEALNLRVRTITERLALHQEIEFARKFFTKGVWQNEWTGATTDNVAQKKFKKFSDASSDPVAFIDARMTDIRRAGRRRPNKIGLGIETFVALKNHPKITERVRYSGTSSNPAVVTEQALAQIFGVEQVVVLDATFNSAGVGEPENMEFVCDSKGALLLYSPDRPAVDLPSAGFCFTWMLNGSDYIALDTFEKNDGSHTDFLEAIIAYDFKKTSDALGCYLTDCV